MSLHDTYYHPDDGMFHIEPMGARVESAMGLKHKSGSPWIARLDKGVFVLVAGNELSTPTAVHFNDQLILRESVHSD